MSELTVEQALQIACHHHQAGQLPQAEALYRQILQQDPNHPDALHLLGVIAYQAGRHDLAVDLIGRAIALKPNFPEAYGNLGNALQAQGQLDAAIAAFRQAIALNPGFAKAHYNLGNASKAKGQLDAAIVAYRQAITLEPNYPEAYGNLGAALHANEQPDAAIAAYRQATVLRPNYPEAYHNLGTTLHSKGQLDAAIAAYRQAIALKPHYPEAHYNLGLALHSQGELDQALAAARQAIALKPSFPEAHNNLGIALKDQGQLDEALAAYRKAIALNPNYPEAHNNLAVALKDQGQLDAAIAAYRQAVALAPDDAGIHSNLVFGMHYHPLYDARSIAAEHRLWNLRHAEPLRKFIQPHANDRNPERRLRIGYVSADFREHPVGRFLLPLLAHHDKNHFQVVAYAQVPVSDAMTQRLRSCADGWRSIVGLGDAQMADLIRQDQIDILVDLTMHTAINRLLVFARKPAPVQVTWLGYPGSTGLTTIDYRLSDPYLDPPGTDESVYSERTVRLPDSFWCYDPLDGREIPCNALPALANGWVTFGCLNNFCKVNDGVLRLWAKVLRAVPSSRLLLLTPMGAARPHVLKLLEQEAIAPQRIELVSAQPRHQYLRSYHRIDLGLDSFPYNGHTTSLDSFWMGVPVVSLVGRTAVGRGGLSILSNVGLPELAARSEEEYVRIASELAGDLPRLGRLRATLRQRIAQSPLMDAPRFARNIEAAYRQMWRKWCAEAPAGHTPPQPQAGRPAHTVQGRNQA